MIGVWRSDIAIDNIEFTKGVCPPFKRTTTAVTTPLMGTSTPTIPAHLLSESKQHHVLNLHSAFYPMSVRHFRVAFCLCFKTSPGAKRFIWKWVWFARQRASQTHFHQDSFWNGRKRQLGNGLLFQITWRSSVNCSFQTNVRCHDRILVTTTTTTTTTLFNFIYKIYKSACSRY